MSNQGIGIFEDSGSTGYITWRRRRVNFDPKVSATMPRPTPAMKTPCARFPAELSSEELAESSIPRSKKAILAGDENSQFFSSSQALMDDTQWIPAWLRPQQQQQQQKQNHRSGVAGNNGSGEGNNNCHNQESGGNERGVSTVSTGAASSSLPGEPSYKGGNSLSGKKACTIDELVSSPMAFTQRLLDLHDELRDVETACQVLVHRALQLDPKTSVTEILEGSSELSYHSIKVDAVDGEIRRIQREITGTFSVVDGSIISGSEAMPAEKAQQLLNSLRACIPEVRSSIRLADTRLTSLLM